MKRENILILTTVSAVILLIMGILFLWPIYQKAKLNRDSNNDINKQYGYYMHHNYIDSNILKIYFSFFKGNRKLLASIKSFEDLSSNNIPLNYLAFDIKSYINLTDGDEFMRRDRVMKIIQSSASIERRINNEIIKSPASFTINFPFHATLLDYNFVKHAFPVIEFSMDDYENYSPNVLDGFCKSEIVNVSDNKDAFYEGRDLLLDRAISSAGDYIGNDDGIVPDGLLYIDNDGTMHFPSTKCDAGIKSTIDYISYQSCEKNKS